MQNRVISLDREYSESELRRAANYLNENYAGKDISEIRKLVVVELQRTQESMNQLMIDTIAFAQAALPDEKERSGYIRKGETKLMGFEELSDIEQLRQLGPSASLPGPPLEWNLYPPLHPADAIFLMEPGGNLSLSLTVRHKH